MVALASWIQPGENASAAKNCVGDFFGPNPIRVGELASQVADTHREKSFRCYDSRRGNSSGQKEKERSWLDQKKCDGAKAMLDANAKVGSFLGNTLGLEGENLVLGQSGGGTLAIPFISALGLGVHGEGGWSVTIDYDNPLNSRIAANVSVAGMVTVGGGGYASGGPIFGWSEGDSSDKIFDWDTSIHTEGAFVIGTGGAVQGDLSMSQDAQWGDSLSDIIDGGGGSFSPRGAVGLGVLAGAGPAVSGSVKHPNIGNALQNWYDKNCK